MNTSTAFAFKALAANGTLERGVLEAPDRDAAAKTLAARGAYPVEIRETRAPTAARIRIGTHDLALGLRALATLLNSGLSISRTLHLLDELVPPAWTRTLPVLRERVEQGDRLAVAMEAAGLPLPGHVLGVIRAGEAGSGLGKALERASQMMEARAARQAELRSALSYPAMLAVAGGATVALLVGVVLPRFVELLGETGQALPTTTRIVLAVGTWAKPGAIWGGLLVGVLVVAWGAWTRSPRGLQAWHGLLLRLPLIGTVRRSSSTANMCAALAAMLETGVPLAAALPHAGRASGDAAVESGLMAARQRVVEGASFASALEEDALLTTTAVRLVRVGEETGELAAMLEHAARIESDGALSKLQRLIRMVEPAMILMFGGVVVIVAAALLQAMYSVRPTP